MTTELLHTQQTANLDLERVRGLEGQVIRAAAVEELRLVLGRRDVVVVEQLEKANRRSLDVPPRNLQHTFPLIHTFIVIQRSSGRSSMVCENSTRQRMNLIACCLRLSFVSATLLIVVDSESGYSIPNCAQRQAEDFSAQILAATNSRTHLVRLKNVVGAVGVGGVDGEDQGLQVPLLEGVCDSRTQRKGWVRTRQHKKPREPNPEHSPNTPRSSHWVSMNASAAFNNSTGEGYGLPNSNNTISSNFRSPSCFTTSCKLQTARFHTVKLRKPSKQSKAQASNAPLQTLPSRRSRAGGRTGPRSLAAQSSSLGRCACVKLVSRLSKTPRSREDEALVCSST